MVQFAISRAKDTQNSIDRGLEAFRKSKIVTRNERLRFEKQWDEISASR
jgi:hypothetical protein